MKKLLFAFCLLFGMSLTVNAQDTTSTQDKSEQYRTDEMNQDLDEDKNRVEISVGDLPTAISDKLQSQDYNAWAVDRVYRKEKDSETIYIVELKQGDDKKKIKFDAQGNEIKVKDKDKDQK